MSIKDAVKLIEESEARFVDLRFTDTKGKQHHFTIPARIVLDDPEEWFENGQAFDGSSIGGWKGIQASDMQLRPDPATAFIDPFFDDTTVVLTRRRSRLRPRPALYRTPRRSLFEIFRYRRHRLFRP